MPFLALLHKIPDMFVWPTDCGWISSKDSNVESSTRCNAIKTKTFENEDLYRKDVAAASYNEIIFPCFTWLISSCNNSKAGTDKVKVGSEYTVLFCNSIDDGSWIEEHEANRDGSFASEDK